MYSFLLNSHHKLFVEAEMKISATNAQDRAELQKKANAVLVEALRRQLELKAD